VLRQQITAAKAAARKAREQGSTDGQRSLPSGLDGSYDYDSNVDPFNTAPKDGKHVLRNRINAARMSGKLNIAAMGLKKIPSEVMQMFDATSMEEDKVNWAEVVDLTKLIAADNELEEIEADVFPETSPDDFNMDDDAPGNQFGGLEMLDLHGNSLSSIPIGLRRLERLTSLNLAHNKLDNSSLEIISQIRPLKELKLGNNNISGNLSSSICELAYLEVLELQSNRLLALPEALRELTRLRILNVSGNQLTSLPMDALQQVPLIELDGSKNALLGSLFPLGGSSEHPILRSLDISNNSLAALTFSPTAAFPQLRTLDITNNHFTALPPITAWIELITLAAGDNKISELPEGFTTLPRLRNVNFSGNSLHAVPPQVANMESLGSLVLASNPLRDKKYLTMTAADIKRDLRAKLDPEEVEMSAEEALSNGDDGHGGQSADAGWKLGANGFLDLAGQNLTDDVIDSGLATFLETNTVRQLLLQNNKLTHIPPALAYASDLRVLDLSSNPFQAATYLPASVSLPNLQELRMRACRITTLSPLLANLSAPELRILDITNNRCFGDLPKLRASWPALTTLIASDNNFSSLSFSALRGFTTVNLSGNDLQSLPAEIGLLWDEGLRNLEVASNAFRVPGYRVLEKGTEATMRWLRDRLPAPATANVVDDELD
jgi:Leucine-rich repeat (LRR) protein